MTADNCPTPVYRSNSPRFVAEVSSNHNQDLERCLKFINVAANIGCAAVKFQLFRIDELFAPEVLSRNSEHRRRKAWELPTEFLPAISEKCQQHRIEFGCTPFYLQAVEELLPFVDFYKIASYELLWDDLLRCCVQTGKPVVLSTGMATMKEIEHAVSVMVKAIPRTLDMELRKSGYPPLTLLHCVSGYPTPVTECNLAAIETLRNGVIHQRPATSMDFGWSDHSVNPGVIFRAIHRWDASMIEFHLDLDGSGEEYQSGHCWLPNQIHSVITIVKTGFDADGRCQKGPSPCELPDRDWRADPTDGLRPIRTLRENWKP